MKKRGTEVLCPFDGFSQIEWDPPSRTMRQPCALYTDENIDGRLVRALRRAGWDLVRAVDLHPPGTDDEKHFQAAADQERLLVTNDDDMLAPDTRQDNRPILT